MKRMNGELSGEVAAIILPRSLSPGGQTSLKDEMGVMKEREERREP